MKKLTIVGAVAAAVLSMTPVSFDWSAGNDARFPVKVQAAKAADLEAVPRRRVHRAYYGRSYDKYCGGPYVGGGWNGGTYWGGPWEDLRCYGVPIVETPAPNPFWWYW
jgi:hypothetical protein